MRITVIRFIFKQKVVSNSCEKGAYLCERIANAPFFYAIAML